MTSGDSAIFSDFFDSLGNASIASIKLLGSEEIEQGNDYLVEWEIQAKPARAGACPITIFGTGDECYGIILSSFGQLADLCNLKSLVGRQITLGGFEPHRFDSGALLGVCAAVVEGRAVVEYRTLFGAICGARLLIENRAFYPIKTSIIGSRHRYAYQSWHAT